jgi:thiol-disulfide isomerase/thioredoxin
MRLGRWTTALAIGAVFTGLSGGCASQDPRVPELEKRIVELEKQTADLYSRVRTKAEVREEAVVGKEAKWEIAEWMQGETTMDEGKATMLVFWEVWCPHCKREVPKLEETYQKLKPQGLNIVGLTRLTRNTTPEQLDAFLKENNVSYPIARDDGTMGDHYAVQGVPAAALVKDDKIVWRGHPAKLNEEMLLAALR